MTLWLTLYIYKQQNRTDEIDMYNERIKSKQIILSKENIKMIYKY